MFAGSGCGRLPADGDSSSLPTRRFTIWTWIRVGGRVACHNQKPFTCPDWNWRDNNGLCVATVKGCLYSSADEVRSRTFGFWPDFIIQ
jgi:hypothetical protein